MTTMGRDDPAMQMLWSPMSRQGHARYATLRSAICDAYVPPQAPPTEAQRLQAKYATAARRSGDAIFFEAFGTPDQLLRMDDDDELCAALFAPAPSSTSEPEPEPEPVHTMMTIPTPTAFGGGSFPPMGGHVSRLAKPLHMQTPKRVSLKRPRADDECSAEKRLRLRKPRLSDTTNLMQTSTSTTTATTAIMANPWDHHKTLSSVVKPSSTSTPFGGRPVSRFEASPYQQYPQHTAPVTTSAFASHVERTTSTSSSTSSSTSTRAFTLR